MSSWYSRAISLNTGRASAEARSISAACSMSSSVAMRSTGRRALFSARTCSSDTSMTSLAAMPNSVPRAVRTTTGMSFSISKSPGSNHSVRGLKVKLIGATRTMNNLSYVEQQRVQARFWGYIIGQRPLALVHLGASCGDDRRIGVGEQRDQRIAHIGVDD